MRIAIILLLVALGLSCVAGYYSIIGMIAIFSAAWLPIAIMTGLLEISKIVLASWLYQNWQTPPKLLRSYFVAAVLILMLITSLGIFGYLSKAHLDQQLDSDSVGSQIAQIDARLDSANRHLQRSQTQEDLLDKSVNVRLTESQAKYAVHDLKSQTKVRAELKADIDRDQTTVDSLMQEKLMLAHKQTTIKSKLGPIKYVAEMFGGKTDQDMDAAVRWVIVMIIVVFDPLAVLMIVAANMSLAQSRPTTVRSDPPPENQEPIDEKNKAREDEILRRIRQFRTNLERGFK